MNKHHQWLAQQIPEWVEDKLLSPEQAEKLRARHPATDSSGIGRLLVTGAGAIMIGLGVILLFAYNWAEMSKLMKLGAIFSALSAAHITGLLKRDQQVLSEGCFGVGTMLMGAAIFLVGQIYHLDSHYPNAFLLWSVGALTLAWALPSLTQAFMAVILITCWHMMEVLDFQVSNYRAFILILIAIFPLVWRLKSPLLARFASAALFLTLGLSMGVVNNEMSTITLLLVASSMIFLAEIIKHQSDFPQKGIAEEIAKPAALLLVIMMISFTFNRLLRELFYFELNEPIGSTILWGTLTFSQLGFCWLAHKRTLSLFTVLTELSIVLAVFPSLLLQLELLSLSTWKSLITLSSISFNLILLATSAWMMLEGAKEGERQQMLRGCFLFTILAISRYTDLFDSLVARASVFLIVGIALFAIGNLYQRNKQGGPS
jgi:uncharacterized membrane protein